MLYLVQHGEAMSKEEDPERPLTARGEADIGRVGALLHRAGIEVDDVFDSGKERARQTAELLAWHLAPERGPETMDGLGATDPVEPIADQVAGWTRRVMLVGHLPFMGRLVSCLLELDEEHPPVDYAPGTVVALARGADRWQIEWMLRPELVRGEA